MASLRSVAAVAALSVALCATATPVRAEDRATSSPYPVRAAIGREAARLAAAGVRRTARQQSSLASRQEAVPQDRSWVGRHPALTGALIGATAGATYGYVMCRGACEGQPQLYMAFLGGIGAGIGAGAGAIVGAVRH